MTFSNGLLAALTDTRTETEIGRVAWQPRDVDDAHVVYARSNSEHDWVWIGTFAGKALAENYAGSSAIPSSAETEVRPL